MSSQGIVGTNSGVERRKPTGGIAARKSQQSSSFRGASAPSGQQNSSTAILKNNTMKAAAGDRGDYGFGDANAANFEEDMCSPSTPAEKAVLCCCGSFGLFTASFLSIVTVALIVYHMHEGFGAAITETIVKQVMPKVNATVVVGHQFDSADEGMKNRRELLFEEAGARRARGNHSSMDSMSDLHRSFLLHNTTASLLTAGLDHLDLIEVNGYADFASMHVLSNTHEGIVAEWAQRVRDGALMCELLGSLIESHEELLLDTDGEAAEGDHSSRTSNGDGPFSSFTAASSIDDAKSLVLELCAREPTKKVTPNGDCKSKYTWVPRKQTYRHYYFHRPSVTKYGAHQWLWDSCFHIMGMVAAWRGTVLWPMAVVKDSSQRPYLRHITTKSRVSIAESSSGGGADATGKHSPASSSSSIPTPLRHSGLYRLVTAILEFRSLFLFQNLETGFVPEMTYWRPDKNQYGIAGFLFGYGDKEKRFTDITQMPMLSFPLQRIVRALRDVEAALREKRRDGAAVAHLHGAAANAKARMEKNAGSEDETGGRDAKPRRPLHQLALAYFAPKAGLYYKYWLDERYRSSSGSSTPTTATTGGGGGASSTPLASTASGAVSIFHPWESGLDASPMYDPFHDFCKTELNLIETMRAKQQRQEVAGGAANDADAEEDYRQLRAAIEQQRLAKRNSKDQEASRSLFESYIAIVDPTTAECPPHPEDLYPKFISLLYRYRHANGWDLRAVRGAGGEWEHEKDTTAADSSSTSSSFAFSSSSSTFSTTPQRVKYHRGRPSQQANRFEVQDVGVNAVLGYNMKLLLEMVDEGVAEEEGRMGEEHAIVSDVDAVAAELLNISNSGNHGDDGGGVTGAESPSDQHHPHYHHTYRAHAHSLLTSQGQRARRHDAYHAFLAEDVLLPTYAQMFATAASKQNTEGAGGANADSDASPVAASASAAIVAYPIAISHSLVDAFIRAMLAHSVAVSVPVAPQPKSVGDSTIEERSASATSTSISNRPPVSVAITSSGWSPREGTFIKTDATRVVQQFMLLLLLSPTTAESTATTAARVETSSPSSIASTAPPSLSADQQALASYFMAELQDARRFGSAALGGIRNDTSGSSGAQSQQQPQQRRGEEESSSTSSSLVSLERLVEELQRSLMRYAGTEEETHTTTKKKGHAAAADDRDSSSGAAADSSMVWGVPTTAVNDMAFVAEDSALMWRGPSWPTTNWYVLEGLGELAERLRVEEEEEEKKNNAAEGRGNIKHDGDRGSSDSNMNNSHRHLTSESVLALKANILRTWTVLVHSNGFSEYYNPLSGEPLGQKGLGMSLSLLDALWGR